MVGGDVRELVWGRIFCLCLSLSVPCLAFSHLSPYILLLGQSPPTSCTPLSHRHHTMSERGPAQNLCPPSSPCGLPQEGALDLLKKLDSCQMSIRLLQVGRGWEQTETKPPDLATLLFCL